MPKTTAGQPAYEAPPRQISMSADEVARIIADAKLGATRKYAQIDSCSVFAEALHEVLGAAGIQSSIWMASPKVYPQWYHSVVQVGDVFFDSLGVFNEDVVRARHKIHPTATFKLNIVPDVGDYEEEFDDLRAFYVKSLTKALTQHLSLATSPVAAKTKGCAP
jgi:hypothetical protein